MWAVARQGVEGSKPYHRQPRLVFVCTNNSLRYTTVYKAFLSYNDWQQQILREGGIGFTYRNSRSVLWAISENMHPDRGSVARRGDASEGMRSRQQISKHASYSWEKEIKAALSSGSTGSASTEVPGAPKCRRIQAS